MKKFIGLFAIAMAVMASSFTIKGKDNSRKFDVSYYWFSPSFVYHDLKTTAAEMVITSCNKVDLTLCENAYNASQLINPGNPSQGVKPGQTPQDTIKKP